MSRISTQKALDLLSIATARSVQKAVTEDGTDKLPMTYKGEIVKDNADGTFTLFRMETTVSKLPFEMPSFSDEKQLWDEDDK